MFKRSSPRVVIAGAGPTGLFGALCLSDQGVDIEILSPTERDPALRRRSSNAAVVLLHPGSLALLHRHGAAAAVIERGRRVPSLRVYRGSECAGEVSFEKLSRGSGLPFDFAVCVARADLEECLRAALRTRRVEVHDQRRLVRFEQGSARVRVTIDHLASDSAGYAVAHSELVVDKSEELEPEFVLAADGHQSVVRQQLGSRLSELRPSERYLSVEGRAPSGAPDASAFGFAAGASSALWQLADGRRHGIFIADATDLAMLGLPEAGVHSEPVGRARLDPEQLSAWVSLRTPWLGGEMTELEARGPFHAHHRLASSFGRGRVWLAGAAAHSSSPLSSLSTNVGLSDAAELAEIFASARHGEAPLEALAAYDAGQRERWQRRLEPESDAEAAGAPARAPVGEHRPHAGSGAPAPGFDALLARLTTDPWSSLLQFGTTAAD